MRYTKTKIVVSLSIFTFFISSYLFAALPLSSAQTILGKWKTKSITKNDKPLESAAPLTILLNLVDAAKGFINVQSGSVTLPEQAIVYTLNTDASLLSLKPDPAADGAMNKLLIQTLDALNVGFLAQELDCAITNFTEKAMTLTIHTKDNNKKDITLVLELTKI